MAETRTLIIHGWSDCSRSFADLKARLIADGIGQVDTILYADYESREDNLTFNDVADGLNDELFRNGLITADGSGPCDLNVIVHSTGGLVIRHWLWRYYLNLGRMDACPVKRVVMLAPANFGSPLAHRGKSMLGSLFKGRLRVGDLFEVGRRLLDGLELGSPYQWEMAHRDLLRSDCCYTASRIRTTILVGVRDYDGVRGWVNKPGTDGTVVISGTALNSLKLVLDCCRPERPEAADYVPYAWACESTPCDYAWGVLEDLDHGSIVDAAARADGNPAHRLLLQALRAVTELQFAVLKTAVDAVTRATYANTGKHRYQQILIHAVDDQGESIRDFTIEFYVMRKTKSVAGGVTTKRLSKQEEDLSAQLQRIVAGEFHRHSADGSFRRLLVDCDDLKTLQARLGEVFAPDPYILAAKVFVPRVDAGIQYRVSALQTIVVHDSSQPQAGQRPTLFYPNTTTLLELRVDRFNTYVKVGATPRRH